MKLASYIWNQRQSYGLVVGDRLVDLGSRLGSRYAGLRELLAAEALSEAAQAADRQSPDCGIHEVTSLAPIPCPEKILCVGRNYPAYHEVAESQAPEWPSIFLRLASSFVGHEAPMVRPRVSDQYDFEGELAVIIGRRGRHIPEAEALGHVAGYTCLNEASVRDWQQHGTQNMPGKNFHQSGAIGPWMVDADAIPDPQALTLTTRLNGTVMQHGQTGDMLAPVAFLISYISTFTWLEPGDIIATGSPGGSGISHTPPLWMKPGDRIEVEISGIGTLANSIAEETPLPGPAPGGSV